MISEEDDEFDMIPPLPVLQRSDVFNSFESNANLDMTSLDIIGVGPIFGLGSIHQAELQAL